MSILIIFLLSNNPGYHLTSCSCSFKFFVRRDTYDCARYCTDEEIAPLTKEQKFINKLLFTDTIAKLCIARR